jgi:hypothetical protein
MFSSMTSRYLIGNVSNGAEVIKSVHAVHVNDVNRRSSSLTWKGKGAHTTHIAVLT